MFEYFYSMGKAKMQQYFGNERGQGITEYAAVLAIVVAIALLLNSGEGNFKDKIVSLYTSIANKITGI